MQNRRDAPAPGQTLWAGLAALAMLAALLAGCASAANTGGEHASAKATPATTQGHLAQRVEQAMGATARDVTLTYAPATGVATVSMKLVWRPAWKDDFAQAQAAAKGACFEAQSALWTSGVALQSVTVTALGQAPDDYDNMITSAYAAATLTSAHASAIQWATTTADEAWPRYDNTFLRPTYVPDWVYPPPAIQKLTPTVSTGQ
ncbi:MAG TPA: hypothetical protein VHI51_11490 [Ktedonobacterales bacterium]|nr:hypothetical protein [Ktedonobacterales bacterium]